MSPALSPTRSHSARRLTPQQRDGVVAMFRRRVMERLGITLFPHQAEWVLASEGYTLHYEPARPGELAFPVCLDDQSTAYYRISPRPSGPAHVITDLAAYKAGKSFSLALWGSGFAVLPGAKISLVGLEYATCQHEWDYLCEFLLSEDGMNMKYSQFYNDPRGGRMFLRLKDGATYECKSWERKGSLKGARITAYIYCEAYQFPGLECYTSISQNLRQERGYAAFATTPDRPWVGELHDRGHGADPDWHCVCGVTGRVNPYTFVQSAMDRDNPDLGGIMTRERYAISWLGQLGTFIGRVYEFQRGQRILSPESHPYLFKPSDDPSLEETAHA